MNTSCSTNPCPILLNSKCVFYTATPLPITGVNTNDNIQTVLIKIEAAFKEIIDGSGIGSLVQTVYVTPLPGVDEFNVAELVGKTLILAVRSGLTKGVTLTPTLDTMYLQIVDGVVTLPIGDVVQPDELFIFVYR